MLTNASCQTPKDKQINAAEKDQALYKKYNLDKIKLPEGFAVSVYAEVSNARSMCWGAKGTLEETLIGLGDRSLWLEDLQ